jgi:antitoxin VapB
MALSIKDPATDKLIRELARLADEPLTTAVRKAVEERLERERLRRGKRSSMYEDLIAISDHCAALPDHDTRTPDEIVGYDENGMW